MPETNLPATGEFGAPPPDAARETTAPLQSDAGAIILADPRTGLPTGEVIDPAARARANEKELKPLNFERPAAPAAQSVVSGKTVDGLDPFYRDEIARRRAEAAAGGGDPTMPAASDSDSPVRGLPGTAPVPAVRKTKPLAVTGGFGDAAEAMYFALTGPELLALAQSLLDKLNERIINDLRFSLALTYPRVNVKLQLVIEGEVGQMNDRDLSQVGAEPGYTIEYLAAHEKTPIEVAKAHGNSVVFVLTEQRREFNEAGEVESPPDAIRKELGLVRPHKQIVQTGQGKVFADLPVGF